MIMNIKRVLAFVLSFQILAADIAISKLFITTGAFISFNVANAGQDVAPPVLPPPYPNEGGKEVLPPALPPPGGHVTEAPAAEVVKQKRCRNPDGSFKRGCGFGLLLLGIVGIIALILILKKDSNNSGRGVVPCAAGPKCFTNERPRPNRPRPPGGGSGGGGSRPKPKPKPPLTCVNCAAPAPAPSGGGTTQETIITEGNQVPSGVTPIPVN